MKSIGRTVSDPKGIHARRAVAIIESCRHLDYTLNGERVTWPADILAMGLGQGSTLTFLIHCEGSTTRLESLVF